MEAQRRMTAHKIQGKVTLLMEAQKRMIVHKIQGKVTPLMEAQRRMIVLKEIQENVILLVKILS